MMRHTAAQQASRLSVFGGGVGTTERRRFSARPDANSAGRALDLLISPLLLLFVAPLLVAIAAAIYAQDRRPILFSHSRIGRNGQMFRCLKFRTMVVDSDARLAALLADDPRARAEWERDHKLRNDPRVTRLGTFLRQSSLDELPQLFNVLLGDMSLVGPRPIVEAEIERYGSRFPHYCAVRPGITGLWQISGRNDVCYRRRVAMDVLYARSKSVWIDIWILLMTIPAVLLKRGSY
jgi:Undecaprenyl-phosphate galactose phosphotransferase WbaP